MRVIFIVPRFRINRAKIRKIPHIFPTSAKICSIWIYRVKWLNIYMLLIINKINVKSSIFSVCFGLMEFNIFKCGSGYRWKLPDSRFSTVRKFRFCRSATLRRNPRPGTFCGRSGPFSVRGQKDNESAERSKYQVYRWLIFCSAYARSNGNSKFGQV